MKKCRATVAAISCALFFAGSSGCARECSIVAPLSAPANMIYDDDCDGDVDCVTTQAVIHNWIDKRFVRMWGMVSSAPSNFGAPALKIFRHYYNHDDLFPIGAWTP